MTKKLKTYLSNVIPQNEYDPLDGEIDKFLLNPLFRIVVKWSDTL